jgi:hypothetical protein
LCAWWPLPYGRGSDSIDTITAGIVLPMRTWSAVMKHKTWFRLVLKAIGILVLAFSAPHLLWVGGASLLEAILTASPAPGSVVPFFVNWDYEWRTLFYNGIEVAFGLYLLFGGKWLVNKCIPSNRPYCPECGYDLSKSSDASCPECGVGLPKRDEQ